MINREGKKACCFTGHRELKAMEFRELGPLLVAVIKKLYSEHGVRVFISGAARGFDTYAAAAASALRDDHPGMEVWLAVPYDGHTRGWSTKERDYFERITQLADKVQVLSPVYDKAVYTRRNRWMVDRSDICVAYFEGHSSGTAQTVAYAATRDVEVINLLDLQVR